MPNSRLRVEVGNDDRERGEAKEKPVPSLFNVSFCSFDVRFDMKDLDQGETAAL